MLRRTPLIRFAGPQLSSGLQPDVHPLMRVLWADAANVVFYANKVRRRVPVSGMFTGPGPAASVRAVSQQQAANGVRWIWAADGPRIVRWYGPSVELIHTLPSYQIDANSTTLATMVDFTHFGDWTVINSSIGPAKLYKPSGPSLVDYPQAPTDVVAFQKRLNFMLAFGYGSRGTRVGWSAADDIETWNPATTNEAGALSIDDFDTPIRAVSRLGNASAVYGEDQLALVQYISSPFYFGQRTVLDGIGAVGKKAVTGDGQRNYGVSRNGIWMTDGSGFRYIDIGLLRDRLQAIVNWEQASKIHACRNDYRGTFEFFFPVNGSTVINEGWGYDPVSGGWSPLLPVQSKDERRLFSRPIAGDTVSQVVLDESNPDSNWPLTLKTKPLTVQASDQSNITDGHLVARVDEVQIFANAASNVEFRIGTSMKINDTPSWSDWTPLSTDSSTYQLASMPDGVYHTLDFRSTAVNWDLDLQGFQLFGQLDGVKRSQQ